MRPERRALQLWELREEELSEGRAEVLPQGSSAGITGGGDCRRDWRRRALTPTLSTLVSPALSSSSNACSHPVSQLLRSALRSQHVKGERGETGEQGEPGERWGEGRFRSRWGRRLSYARTERQYGGVCWGGGWRRVRVSGGGNRYG